MIEFDMQEFLARSTDKPFEETTLHKVLFSLPTTQEDGPWIAGGAVRRTLQGNEPDSDFDFFFRDANQLARFATNLETRGFEKIRETEHHLHYRGRVTDMALILDIQCIRFAFYPNAAAVIDSFDFTICQFVFDGTTLTVGDYALWDLGRKRLAIHKLTYPVSTMRRMLKYTGQGFYACAGALSTILRETAQSPELQQQLNIQYVD